ncbi:hypothetical protein NDR87_35660 [Nocardia sp. CDC159]|uniref:Uncharacterized protein n=1 Tax=Nocardia pulmonis TaxID=2951408 RepID=A0A9X2J380_9NOCA|nr:MULTISPECIES: hypothetical protein [Nocardia]MCM6778826.1 hypothetical protein [Nocardia pulmonis]MCM6791715.1 hypothetical protein [Nocardia sp. CDC159]
MNARADLERELGGSPGALDDLTEPEIADLLGLFRAAHRHEAATLNAAIDAMVGALPRPLRGITKRIMFGDRLDR